ncbi:hypothetical protein [Methylomonas rapida]|uniref:Uncharacterized protein n=1 Tax=Methylomonas rapida TaxID=2963939 RepID=A0ABY7GG85_9GAMM|nr:hypothetical protein [Methylomonas rapida]WAR44285.1 hypothetical protein NM686_018250 [Methylomonas rapida]
MDFPSFVPEGARSHAIHFLGHYEPALAECEARLVEIQNRINEWSQSRLDNDTIQFQITKLRQSKAEQTKYRDDFARDIASIKRLVHDARMKEAYQILTNAFFDDEDSERQRKFDGFIYAAWSARLDFSPYREGLKQAAELRDEIAKTADKLAGLLDRIGETGVLCPGEFFYIPSLLRNTDNHEMDDHNLYMWRAMRGYVLGDLPQRETLESEQTEIDPAGKPEIVFQIVAMDEKPDIDPAEEARNTLRYAWEKSPPLSELLKTVSKVAKEFKPSESGVIGAAIDSRKQSLKAEYLRAFGNLLTEQHGFMLTTDIMKAMAIAANVVINAPDIDTTYDDVRKALAKLGGDSLEDSRAK